MVKQLSYKFIAMFMLILFIAASTGLSFYIHNCTCSHSTFTSIFEEHKCHKSEPVSCCNASHESITSLTKSGCGCKSIHFSIKFDDNYNSSNYTFETKVFSYLIAKISQPTLGLSNTNQNLILDKGLYIPDDSPPIQPVGRILVYLLHQSKTPGFLS
jgi:hypothetical protein